MIFVDAGAWLCLLDDHQDPANVRVARSYFKTAPNPFATSDLIAAETYKWMLFRDRPFSKRFSALKKLAVQELAVILPIEKDDRVLALALMEKFSDQTLSYEDAVSVALMRRFGIEKIFSFDKHFLLFPSIKRVP
jgi:predicted nucleic acid-binding protein